MNTAWHAASEEMAKAAQSGPQPGADQQGPGPGAGTGNANGGGDQEVTDADFEEVK